MLVGVSVSKCLDVDTAGHEWVAKYPVEEPFKDVAAPLQHTCSGLYFQTSP